VHGFIFLTQTLQLLFQLTFGFSKKFYLGVDSLEYDVIGHAGQ
jgi:hypothetical protein